MDHLRKSEMTNIALGLGLMANFKPALDDMISGGVVELLFGISSFDIATFRCILERILLLFINSQIK